MTIDDWGTLIMTQLGWFNMWLFALTVVLGITVGYLVRKLKKQDELIDDILYKLDEYGYFSSKM